MQPGITPKHTLLALMIGMAASLPAHAIEIEQRPLTPAQGSAPTRQAAPQPAPTAQQPATARPAAAAAPAPAAVNPAWDMFQQLESLQATVASLQGQVEEQQQLIERMREDLRVRYTDLDQRLELLNKQPEPAATPENGADAAAADAAGHAHADPAIDPAAAAPATPATAPVTPAAPAAGTAPVAVPVPIVEKPAATPAAQQPASTVVGNDSAADIEKQKQAYLAAYQRFRADGAPAAITAMQSFVKQYPNSIFAPNAHYWLGEFQLALEPANYQAAETSFNRVIRDYEGNPKVPSSYYKLGTIADLRGQRNEARRWMQDVLAKFPSSPEARLAQAYLDQNPANGASLGGTR
ncbi:YbgF trimerization domain-containing protein [Amnimonas aquatica]|uniref:Cell division coordinator CpoB n=1 Tax=Amnimonas aquatica TaxID=2094561 RepID=A0A2P6AV09_9GAMM|nr:YbgF trimerization domain-containing protein [Amnimonas aquatica]PQA51902.1 hypothetical protein C5O18_01065 [Amnimonas aquatica]